MFKDAESGLRCGLCFVVVLLLWEAGSRIDRSGVGVGIGMGVGSGCIYSSEAGEEDEEPFAVFVSRELWKDSAARTLTTGQV